MPDPTLVDLIMSIVDAATRADAYAFADALRARRYRCFHDVDADTADVIASDALAVRDVPFNRAPHSLACRVAHIVFEHRDSDANYHAMCILMQNSDPCGTISKMSTLRKIVTDAYVARYDRLYKSRQVFVDSEVHAMWKEAQRVAYDAHIGKIHEEGYILRDIRAYEWGGRVVGTFEFPLYIITAPRRTTPPVFTFYAACRALFPQLFIDDVHSTAFR